MKDIQLFVGIILHSLDLLFAIFSKFASEQWLPCTGLSISLVGNFLLEVFQALYLCQRLPGLTEKGG